MDNNSFGTDATPAEKVGCKDKCDTETFREEKPCSEKRKKGCGGGCWPVIIFVIIAVIILIGIVVGGGFNNSYRAWSFFGFLIFAIIWGAIIWGFCYSGQHAIAWFLLLLPIAIMIFWALAYFLAASTTTASCVGGKDTGKTVDVSKDL